MKLEEKQCGFIVPCEEHLMLSAGSGGRTREMEV